LPHRHSEQGEIADDVENFMAHESVVGKPQRIFVHILGRRQGQRVAREIAERRDLIFSIDFPA